MFYSVIFHISIGNSYIGNIEVNSEYSEDYFTKICIDFFFLTGVDETILTEMDLKNLLIAVQDVAFRWYNIGIHLDFLDGELKSIQNMPLLLPEGVNGFLREMLSQWLKRAPPKHQLPTIECLAVTLRSVGQERIAHDLIQKWKGLCVCQFV